MDFSGDDAKFIVEVNIKTAKPGGGNNTSDFVKSYTLPDLKEVKSYVSQTGSVKSVRLSPDERSMASVTFDSTARIWDIESGKELLKIEQPVRTEAVEFSPDGNYLLLLSFEDSGVLSLLVFKSSYADRSLYMELQKKQ